MPPRSRLWAKQRSTISARSLKASRATPDLSRARLITVPARKAGLLGRRDSRDCRPEPSRPPVSDNLCRHAEGPPPSVPHPPPRGLPRPSPGSKASWCRPRHHRAGATAFGPCPDASCRLHLGDLGLGVALRNPIRVGKLLALALPLQTRQISVYPAFPGHRYRAPHDVPQRRVGLHGRGIDADALALDQPRLVS